MKTRILIPSIVLTGFLFMAGCGDSRRPSLSDKDLMTLEDPEKAPKKEVPAFVPDSTIPAGVKYTESRSVKPAAPPILLDFSKPDNLEEQEFFVAEYFTRVRYITLEHPDEVKEIVADSIVRKFGISAAYTGKYIFSCSHFHGLHCYNEDGSFLTTIAPPSNIKPGKGVLTDEVRGFLGAFSVLGDDCLFVTWEDVGMQFHFYNIPSQTVYRQKRVADKKWGTSPILLSHSTYGETGFDPFSKEKGFLMTFGIQGDTLCCFRDYLPKVTVNQSYAMPDDAFLYKFNNQYSIRQPYNDTIFRVSSEKELTPAYVFDFGAKYCDKKTGLVGDKSDKLIPWSWKEGSRFAFFIYSENYDCFNNRKKKAIRFFYTYYDKSTRRLYRIPYSGLPESFLIANPLPAGMPFFANQIRLTDNRLSVAFTKNSLEKLMQHEAFENLPEAQKANTQEWYHKIGEDELLMMVLE